MQQWQRLARAPDSALPPL